MTNLQTSNKFRWFLVQLFFCLILIGITDNSHSAEPAVEDLYKKYFYHYQDNRVWYERAINFLNYTDRPVGRSIALIAGISNYPYLRGKKDLIPAGEDIKNLANYLKEVEHFDEIVVLKDNAVTYENFMYFFSVYFPEQLGKYPKPRFLFAYSGHGFEDGLFSYILKRGAKSLDDKRQSINLGVLRELIMDTVKESFYTLILINSCNSGAFHIHPYSNLKMGVPKLGGAHAITASGTQQKAWHLGSEGSGSVFFEKLFKALEKRRADKYPDPDGDGLITIDELAIYLKSQVRFATKDSQIPRMSSLSKDSGQGFFFFDREKQIQLGNSNPWVPPEGSISFGGEDGSLPPLPSTIEVKKSCGDPLRISDEIECFDKNANYLKNKYDELPPAVGFDPIEMTRRQNYERKYQCASNLAGLKKKYSYLNEICKTPGQKVFDCENDPNKLKTRFKLTLYHCYSMGM